MKRTLSSMISLASLLAFFGCSKPEVREPQPLPLASVGATPDEIASQAFGRVIDVWPKGVEKHHVVAALPRPWRIVYTTYWLDCEVKNGGFHQFFWNSDGRLNAETLEDLKEIGAEPFVKIYSDALRVYEAKDYAGEKARAGNSWEGFTEAYMEKRMGELDALFYKESKSLASFLGEYVLRNRASYSEPRP